MPGTKEQVMEHLSREELAARLKEVSLLEGDFVLRSGKRSKYYFDKYLFEGTPDVLREVARHLAELIPDGVGQLAGVELGGIPLVTALSLETGFPAVFVRGAKKEYGTKRIYEGPRVSGARVLIVEDVITTGGAALEGAERLGEEGFDVEGVLAVLDRLEGGRERFEEAGVRLISLFTRDDIGMP